MLSMATDYAVHLGKCAEEEKNLSMQWFYSFMSRWPELHVVKPSSLSEQRARCASEGSITNYFEELDRIPSKYNLKDKPHAIYNIDEKGINTEYKPPNVVAGRGYQPQTVNSKRSKTVTLIGAGNALGCQIPSYFVFPGQRLVPELLNGKTVGTDATMTTSGWSNSDVFRTYMKDYFLKYVQGREAQYILVLYDGHKSHISRDLIDWARENNIILFVLPPHCSHILQPMDVGCFGPLQVIYNQECLTFSQLDHKVVTRYDVCSLACKAYTVALSPTNLRSAFAKAGIFPCKTATQVIESLGDKSSPSKLYNHKDIPEEDDKDSNKENNKENEESNTTAEHEPQTETLHENQARAHDPSEACDEFFVQQGGVVAKKVEKKRRRNISTVVGGKAVTEDETVDRMKVYIEESVQLKKKRPVNKTPNKTPNKVSSNPPKKSSNKTPRKSPKKTSPKNKGFRQEKQACTLPKVMFSSHL